MASGACSGLVAGSSASSPLKKGNGRAALYWGLDRGARRGGVSGRYANRSATRSQAPRQGCPEGCGRFQAGHRCATLAVAACYGSTARALPNSKSPRNAAMPLLQRAASLPGLQARGTGKAAAVRCLMRGRGHAGRHLGHGRSARRGARLLWPRFRLLLHGRILSVSVHRSEGRPVDQGKLADNRHP